MSHVLGSMCETHGWVMSPDTCPECPRTRHGYTFQPCDERCPEHVDYDTGIGT